MAMLMPACEEAWPSDAQGSSAIRLKSARRRNTAEERRKVLRERGPSRKVLL